VQKKADERRHDCKDRNVQCDFDAVDRAQGGRGFEAVILGHGKIFDGLETLQHEAAQS